MSLKENMQFYFMFNLNLVTSKCPFTKKKEMSMGEIAKQAPL